MNLMKKKDLAQQNALKRVPMIEHENRLIGQFNERIR